MKLKCKRCGYTWEYTGKRKSGKTWKATTPCPQCRANTELPIKPNAGDNI